MGRGRPRLGDADRLERERRARLLRGWRDRWVSDADVERALDVYLAGKPKMAMHARMEDEPEDLEEEVMVPVDDDTLAANALAEEMCPQDFKFKR